MASLATASKGGKIDIFLMSAISGPFGSCVRGLAPSARAAMRHAFFDISCRRASSERVSPGFKKPHKHSVGLPVSKSNAAVRCCFSARALFLR